MSRLRLRVVVAAFAMVLFSVGVTHAQNDEKHLRWSISVGVGSLDPYSVAGASDGILVMNVYSGLVRHRPGSLTEVDPDLAERWTVSDDGLVYTFYLRRGVQFHDGYGEVTAHDVKFSWDRVLNPDSPGSGRPALQRISSIEVLDDYTVEITLSQPSQPFLIEIAHSSGTGIVSRRAVEERGDQFRYDPVGSGPYQVESAQSGGGAVLVAFDEYWEGRPAIDRVTMLVVPEETVATLALLSGEIDYAIVRDPINVVELQRIEKIGGPVRVNADVTMGDGFFAIFFNTTRSPLDNQLVRQALAHALDRQAIALRVNEGLIDSVAHTVIPPQFLGHTTDVRRYDYDPERARQLLEEAGFADGFTVAAMVQNNNPFMVATLPILQAMWAEVGVTMVAEVLDRGIVRDRQASGDYDITLSTPTRAESNALLAYFYGPNAPRSAFSYYDAVDDLIEQQAVTADREERIALIEEIQRQIAEDVPAIPLWYPIEISAARSNVTGLIPNLGGWQARFWLFDIE